MTKDWSAEDRQTLRVEAPVKALKARIQGRSANDVAVDMLALARAGLERRSRLDALGSSEAIFLKPLEEIALTGEPLASRRLKSFHENWADSVEPAFEECVM